MILIRMMMITITMLTMMMMDWSVVNELEGVEPLKDVKLSGGGNR